MNGILRHKKTGVTINLKDWEVIEGKETLFTTHDGVEMVLGQKFWFVVVATWDIFSGINYTNSERTCVYFSSQKRAKQYVEMLKKNAE